MNVLRIAIASLLLVTGLSFAADSEQTVTFEVDKMTCATCPIAVRKAMQRVDGVKKVEVDFDNKTAVVTFDPESTTPAEIGKASTDVGFPAVVQGED